jgi:hypothetical protein
MKKLLYFAALLLCAGLTSCEKEEIGGTATEAMAGKWYVSVDAVDENGNLVYSDDELFGIGRFHIITNNTAANIPTEMVVNDLGGFWQFKVKVNCDQQSLTFQTNTTQNNNLWPDYEDINVSITGGKILPKAGRQNNGAPADSIVFYVSFSDDEYPAAYGYAKYKVSGIRYSGLEEND